MSDNSPYTLRWGIMATGGIAEVFSKDLLTDPSVRNVHGIRHEIAAVASSTSAEKAAQFMSRINGPQSTKLYGSYKALISDSDVDIVYVATPHSHHFQNAMLALKAGKNVLCEKPLTVTAAQARRLVDTATEQSLFLMEAVKTRFFPASIQIRERIASGEIGTVYRTFADMSINHTADRGDQALSLPDSHRLLNPSLAGGALLDLGIYSLTWVFQTLYHLQKDADKEAPTVVAALNQYATGVDDTSAIICQFPRNKSIGVATTSIVVGTNPREKASSAPAVRIQGSRGEIQVPHPSGRPVTYTIVKRNDGGAVQTIDCPVPVDAKRDWGHGMFWQADECARCLRDGLKQSPVMPWSESIAIMETIDEAFHQGGITYPDLITTHIFDRSSPLNTGCGLLPNKKVKLRMR